ncbi:MAG: Wzz/FepE/Etk N-terminal domain-containing protein [Planctomycetota bacterium]
MAQGQVGSPPPVAPPRSLIEILLHRKWTVVFWVVLGLGLGALYQYCTPPKFESSAQIVVLGANTDSPASPLASAGLSTGVPSTHASILLSTPVLEQALQDPAVAESTLLHGVAHPLHFLRKELKVSASDETETVSIRFIGEDPIEAAALVTAIVHAYFAHQGLPVRGMGPSEGDHPTTSVMDEQVIASQLLYLSQQVGEARINADLARARRDRAIASVQDISQLQQLLKEAGADTQTIGVVNLMAMNAQLSRLAQQLQSMPESWGAEHRLRVPVQQQYDALAERYYMAEQRVRQQAISQLESAYLQADTHLGDLEERFTELQAQAELARTSSVRVIDPPRVATRKSSPIAIKSLGVAGFLGLILGGFFAVRSEMRSPTAVAPSDPHQHGADGPWEVASVSPTALMRSQDDLEQVETVRDIPLLGAVPELSTGDRLTTPNFTSTASSIHQIRAVLQVQAHAQGTQSYAFTSPRRGAGKTSVAIGVASSLAVAGTRTLVVDCDLAGRIVRGQTGRPANPGHIDPFGPIDRQIGSPQNQSLDDIAVGQGYIKDDTQRTPVASQAQPKVGIVGMLEGRPLDQCAVKATVDGLWLLPASEAETHHIGQMSDAFIRNLLDQARDQFDLVLFDTGPVPGSVEALLVTSQVDGVIVVVPQGESGKALDRTVSYLKVVSAKVIGTVFNHAKPGAPDSFEKAAASAEHAAPRASKRGDDVSDEDELADDIGHDIDEAMGSVPLGSGILAAAVFADKNSGFASDDWELRGTSEFPGDTEKQVRRDEPASPLEVSDILPPD